MQRANRLCWLLMLITAVACNKKSKEAPSPAVASASGSLPADSTVVPQPPPIPPNPAVLHSIATRALRAHAAKDGQALVDLTQPSERERAVKEILPGGAAWESYFADRTWRMKAVKAWDGDLHEMRMDGSRIRIRFATLEDNRAGVVELIHENGGWHFRDIKRPVYQAFLAWGRSLPSIPPGRPSR